MEENQAIRDLENLIDCKIVGIVRAIKPLAYDGDWNEYYGLKIDNPTMEEGYILWLTNNTIDDFFIENFDDAEDFEEI